MTHPLNERVPFHFFPLERFQWWKENSDGEEILIGDYLPGNRYNCTLEERHSELFEKCKSWLSEGKIRISPVAKGSFQTIKVN